MVANLMISGSETDESVKIDEMEIAWIVATVERKEQMAMVAMSTLTISGSVTDELAKIGCVWTYLD